MTDRYVVTTGAANAEVPQVEAQAGTVGRVSTTRGNVLTTGSAVRHDEHCALAGNTAVNSSATKGSASASLLDISNLLAVLAMQ